MAATEAVARVVPSSRRRAGWRRPAGNGLFMVRCMTLSMSRSYHMLMAPAAPAPSAMQAIAVNPTNGSSCPGASSMPTSAVNTTSDITRGFSRIA